MADGEACADVLGEKAVPDFPAKASEGPFSDAGVPALGIGRHRRTVSLGQVATRQVGEHADEKGVGRLLAGHKRRAGRKHGVEDFPLAGSTLDEGGRTVGETHDDAGVWLRGNGAVDAEGRVVQAAARGNRVLGVGERDLLAARQVLRGLVADCAW